MQKSFHEVKFDMEFKGRYVEVITKCFELPEDTDPADSFEMQEDIDAVRSGKYGWCCIKVETVIKFEGVTIGTGSDFLGCVSFKDTKDLIEVMEAHDMTENSLKLAKQDADTTINVVKHLIGV